MNFLVDFFPPKVRRYIYGGLALLALVYGTWQAKDGDWGQVLTALITLGGSSLAHANTNGQADDEGFFRESAE